MESDSEIDDYEYLLFLYPLRDRWLLYPSLSIQSEFYHIRQGTCVPDHTRAHFL